MTRGYGGSTPWVGPICFVLIRGFDRIPLEVLPVTRAMSRRRYVNPLPHVSPTPLEVSPPPRAMMAGARGLRRVPFLLDTTALAVVILTVATDAIFGSVAMAASGTAGTNTGVGGTGGTSPGGGAGGDATGGLGGGGVFGGGGVVAVALMASPVAGAATAGPISTPEARVATLASLSPSPIQPALSSVAALAARVTPFMARRWRWRWRSALAAAAAAVAALTSVAAAVVVVVVARVLAVAAALAAMGLAVSAALAAISRACQPYQ